MPESLRPDDRPGYPGGWFEEDVDWCMVVVAFPSCFLEAEIATAEDRLRNWRPTQWEALRGRTLVLGESFIKDQCEFDRVHAADWVVISAYGAWSPNVPKGFVGVVATRGGQRGGDTPEGRWFGWCPRPSTPCAAAASWSTPLAIGQ